MCLLARADAEDGVCGAPADNRGQKRNEADPAPDGLIGGTEEPEGRRDERQTHDDAQDAINGSDIGSHCSSPIATEKCDAEADAAHHALRHSSIIDPSQDPRVPRAKESATGSTSS